MPDNNINEIDTQRFTLGPVLSAIAIFIMLLIAVVGTWYVTKQNLKGDIAESEIDIRKNDNKAALKLEIEHDKDVQGRKDELAKKKFIGDWTTKSVGELRDGVQQSEEH